MEKSGFERIRLLKESAEEPKNSMSEEEFYKYAEKEIEEILKNNDFPNEAEDSFDEIIQFVYTEKKNLKYNVMMKAQDSGIIEDLYWQYSEYKEVDFTGALQWMYEEEIWRICNELYLELENKMKHMGQYGPIGMMESKRKQK